MTRRVVVTGVGLVSCLGHDYETVLDAIQRGQSGVRQVPEEWLGKGLKSLVAGTIENLDDKQAQAGLSKKLIPGMSDAARFCCIAANDAVLDAGWGEGELQTNQTICIVGTGVGSVDAVQKAANLYNTDRIRRVDPYTVLRCMSSSASAAVSNFLKIRGRSYSLSSACATSAHNIGHAVELIRAGIADRAVAGGGEDITELITAAFQGLRLALSTRYNDTPTQGVEALRRQPGWLRHQRWRCHRHARRLRGRASPRRQDLWRSPGLRRQFRWVRSGSARARRSSGWCLHAGRDGRRWNRAG